MAPEGNSHKKLKLTLLNAHDLPDVGLDADVCIAGAGAAGLTLAREFANSHLKVVILESGGMKFDHRTQLLYRAENRGREYQSVEFTKRRQFGGSTVTWFGRCRPLDEIDFEARSWIPYSGWPFSKSHLDPFYARARAYCQLASDNYEVEEEYFGKGAVQTKRFYFSPPTNFGEVYRNEIINAGNIDIVLNANVVHIALDRGGAQVENVQCRTLGGKSFRVRAKIFILAASALENTRLLLASRDVHTNGIGNQRDLLGRYFMEHPHIFSAAVTSLPDDLPQKYVKLNYDFEQKNLELVDAIGLAQETMRRENLLNACVFLVSRPHHKTRDVYYSKKISGLINFMEVLQHAAPPSADLARSAVHMLKNGRSVTDLLISALHGKMNGERRYTLRAQIETIPNPESRVTLSDSRDALGVPRISLNWKTSDLDVESYQRFETILYGGLEKAGMSVRKFSHDLAPDGWPVSMRPGKHHMGTTRMHRSEARGVVDENCRVHGVNNLYVTGGSVFPTCGMANPTLTIVALAIRLADHVKFSISG